MISRIHGTLASRTPGTVEVATAGGVTYELEIPLTVFERLPREGTTVELRVFQVVREDAITLYGFLDGRERAVFARLLTASGVGPRLALAMLSTMPPDSLVRAILERDTVALRRIPGLGTKKAERLVLELADRMDDQAAAIAAPAGAGRAGEDGVGALVALGYSAPQASAAIRRALDEADHLEGIALIKAALAVLGARE